VNPAAIGAVVVTLLGVTATAWWVATPGLLAVTAIGTAIVLYRTRRLPLGILFIALSLALVTVRLAAGGYDPVEAFTTALTSYPIVFLAGFMLSEPLTLPPRRWQQLALAIVVSLMFSLPFNIGPVFMTPELALVIGNVLAFLAGQRRGIRLTFLGSRPLARGVREFAFEPASAVAFSAGQYMELSLPHAKADSRGERRVFSIASAPGDSNRIAFGLRVPERSSSLKSALGSLSPGDMISATTVGGDFLLPADVAKPVLLVAGGIGITPFVSQLSHDRGTGSARDVVLIYAVPDGDDIAYGDLLSALPTRVLLIAPTTPLSLPPGWQYLGPAPLTNDMLTAAVPDLTARAAYVSGPPALVDEARRVLRIAGARGVSTDYFSGY
jgi:ferredoxin-NADP reductase